MILICTSVFDFLQIKVSSGRTLLLKETLAPSTVPEKTGIVRAPKREHEAVTYFYLEICRQQVVNQCLRIPSNLTSVHFSIQVIGDTWKWLEVEAEDGDEDEDEDKDEDELLPLVKTTFVFVVPSECGSQFKFSNGLSEALRDAAI